MNSDCTVFVTRTLSHRVVGRMSIHFQKYSLKDIWNQPGSLCLPITRWWVTSDRDYKVIWFGKAFWKFLVSLTTQSRTHLKAGWSCSWSYPVKFWKVSKHGDPWGVFSIAHTTHVIRNPCLFTLPDLHSTEFHQEFGHLSWLEALMMLQSLWE